MLHALKEFKSDAKNKNKALSSSLGLNHKVGFNQRFKQKSKTNQIIVFHRESTINKL
jgi:hypothetical protein